MGAGTSYLALAKARLAELRRQSAGPRNEIEKIAARFYYSPDALSVSPASTASPAPVGRPVPEPRRECKTDYEINEFNEISPLSIDNSPHPDEALQRFAAALWDEWHAQHLTAGELLGPAQAAGLGVSNADELQALLWRLAGHPLWLSGKRYCFEDKGDGDSWHLTDRIPDHHDIERYTARVTSYEV